MKVDDIRERFLSFFESRGHRIHPSDSLIPRNDPSLLFTGAGMNQFKEEFLGRVKGSKRAATCQKCLRTGDLENVGRTAGHHTFFEMLGNFSFGDYFKKDAIFWAWEFLTKEMGLKEKDLWVSVYKEDKEAYEIWKDTIGVSEQKILKLGEKDNFWPSNAPSDGPNGPCGPCSEIFFGGPDGIEIWNLVFTQFDRKDKAALEPLPNKNIDTGMGLERIARVLQGKENNFGIDSFQPIITEIINLSRRRSGTGSGCPAASAGQVGRQKINAIADHIRAVTFAISDGVLPSNEERGYVIRKLIRKAFWHGREIGLDEPFLYKVVPVVAQVMKKPYPELTDHRESLSQIVMEEEKRFKNTIDDGVDRLKIMIGEAKGSGILPGDCVFKLYDTYGFPMELTKEIAEGENIKVDMEGFWRRMAEQKAKSKVGSNIEASIFDKISITDTVTIEIKRHQDKTPFVEDEEELETKVLHIVSGNAEKNEIKKGDSGVIFLERTNFYGEKGGQTGDTGWLIKNGKTVADISNAVDVAGITQHRFDMKEGGLKQGDSVIVKINSIRREDIKKNHTATHLLHSALRKVLGSHVKQAGSLVAPDRLRFDFSHFKAVTDEELARIENIVNENIGKGSLVSVDETTIEEAKKKGAIALFGEKYGEIVRMVSVGDYSRELCGGTHVRNSGDIGVFKIISESSIASGMRRIEAVTGRAAYDKIKQDGQIIDDIAKELNVKPQCIDREIEALSGKLKNMEKILEVFINKNVQQNAERMLNSAREINGVKVIIDEVKEADSNRLRKNADFMRARLGRGIFMLIADKDGKISIVVGVDKSLEAKGLNAAGILNDIGADFNIKGGGRWDFAQAGSRSGPKISDILKKAEEVILTMIRRNMP